MTEFNNAHTSLDDVHVGDHVAINGRDNYWILATVTDETKTTLTAGGTKFIRRNGREWNTNDFRYYSIIRPLGSTESSDGTHADRIRADVFRKAEDERRNKALATLREVTWRRLSTDALAQIAAIVEAEKVKEETK